MSRAVRIAASLLLVLAVTACGSDDVDDGEPPPGSDGSASAGAGVDPGSAPTSLPPEAAGIDLIDRIAQAGEYQSFLSGLVEAELEGLLRGGGPFTVFAPTDAAFAALPAVQRNWLLAPANRDKLRQLLQFHIVEGVYTAQSLGGRNIQLESLAGRPLRVDFTGQPAVNFAGVNRTDIFAGNGVVHGIDTVLVPF